MAQKQFFKKFDGQGVNPGEMAGEIYEIKEVI